MDTPKEERIIIGETERAGLLISAPVIHDDLKEPTVSMGTLRWRQSGQSFVLEHLVWTPKQKQWCWVEVPCYIPPEVRP